MSRVKVCDPGEFIASLRPKNFFDTAAWSENSVELINNTSLASSAQRVVKVKLLRRIKIHVGACHVLLD